MKADFLSQAFVHALAFSQCPLSSKPALSTHNASVLSLPFAPVSLSGDASENPFSQLASDAPVPESTDASLEANVVNPHAKRPKFDTNLKVHATHRQELNLNRVQTCPVPGVFSCTNEAEQTTACCVQKPGGVLLHVQLWDVGIGLPESWGIHGLWPDLCNGGYDESTDGDGRAYSPQQISDVLANAGNNGQSLVDFMNQVWLSNDDSPSEFWAHEWKTHGVRVSTLDPSCFNNYQTAQEVPLFFETVVNLFRQLDTYKMLATAGITPSDDQTYALADMQNAVEQGSGYVPDFVCKGRKLSQVEYYLRAQGPVQDGNFVQSHPTRNSNCPDEGIEYPVKYPSGGQGQSNRESERGGREHEGERGGREHEGETGWHEEHHHERHHGHERRNDEY
ncbi:ribonuclease T2 [Calocera viscosa TUFC12733]|uniref:Ribonuclease T2 n=1 Tax=Calocera viscosa (strain TUFC12733) TaxID=1330018 RepID=A0A167Q4D0_CALVF|nr:ribonuclease T2 [Calocera viscosa TUFC12733]